MNEGAATTPVGRRKRPGPTIAVIGNPNAGKSTVFNRLTGLSQRVGNYPGVTVEKKVGRCVLGPVEARLVDLPGTYSLAAHSPDEMVAVDLLLGHLAGEARPDLVLQIVDASNLERNLYLFSQVLELGLPVVVALNMTDVAAARGVHVDADKLSRALGVPVVAIQGHRGTGLGRLREVLRDVLERLARDGEGIRPIEPFCFEGEMPVEVDRLREAFASGFRTSSGRDLHRVEVLRAVIDRGGHAERRLIETAGRSALETLEAARNRLSGALPLAALEAKLRYAWVRGRVHGSLRREPAHRASWSERIDGVLSHKVYGFVIFAGAMLLIFQSIFAWAQPLMDILKDAFAVAGASLGALLPQGALRSLVEDGVVAGVGMVVVFLPQILILFLFIGILEDCGYMARAAFLMDRVMRKCGLSGKSFIPMLSGFACAVPGIMATRVIEDRKDRLATILVTPLMSCSARLPVYAIFIGTFIPDTAIVPGILGLQAVTLFGLYLLGVVAAVAMAWIFRRTLLRGAKAPFVLELPSYKWPHPAGVLIRLYDRARAFLVRAGTTILAISIVVWALAYFPRSSRIGDEYALERERIQETSSPEERAVLLESISEEEAGAYLRDSYFGRAGRFVEPVFKPLGWDWRISMAAIASFPAREVVVSTLGTIYNLGKDVDEESTALRSGLAKATWPALPGSPPRPVFNIPVALSIMVFFALCCQCGATVATIKRETNSWAWAFFAFGYMTVLAYMGALVTYQVGSWVG